VGSSTFFDKGAKVLAAVSKTGDEKEKKRKVHLVKPGQGSKVLLEPSPVLLPKKERGGGEGFVATW